MLDEKVKGGMYNNNYPNQMNYSNKKGNQNNMNQMNINNPYQNRMLNPSFHQQNTLSSLARQKTIINNTDGPFSHSDLNNFEYMNNGQFQSLQRM